MPAPESSNLDEWDFLIDCLAGRILWDDDWNLERLFIDAEPERNRHVKAHLGIDDDYFIDVAPDPMEQELRVIRERLAALDRATQ